MKKLLILGVLAVMSLQADSSKESRFSVDLYGAIGENENLVFSPYSIRSCLGLAYMGAEGKTALELAKGLRFAPMSKEQVAESFAENEKIIGDQIKIANRIFLNKGYKVSSNFSKLSEQSFDSGAENMDFSKSGESEFLINKWVEKETSGKIKNLLAPGTIDGDTSALLVNAIYFKAEWDSPFPHLNSRKMDFFSTPSKPVQADFMYDDEYFKWGAIEDLDATAVEMLYKDGNFSMVIVLPNEKDGLSEMARKVQNNYNLMGISDKVSFRKIDIYIPKFETEYELDLNSPLMKLGIKTMFTNEADFQGLFSGSAPPVKISKAFHKAVIKVDEAGTEAAASTYLKAYPMSLSLDQRTFKANHPFLWYIKDNNNIYFMGQFTKF